MLLDLLICFLGLGVFILFFIPSNYTLMIKQLSLLTSAIIFFFSLFLWLGFDQSTPKFQFIVHKLWLPFHNFNFVLGIDGISLFFILLTTFIFPLCILASWSFKENYIKSYMIFFLSLELILILVFISLDILFFYVFFEGVLIPMFLLIGFFGSRERKIRASYLFFLYTLVGSLFMLIGVIYFYFVVGSTNFEILFISNFSFFNQKWLWLALFISFAAKVPMLPVHIWLPEAHVEAPTAGSVILAGILLKLGLYGFLRFSLGLLPLASFFFSPFIFSLSVFGVIYASFTAIRQTDLKRLIAYTSVSHMNLVILGLFTCSIIGVESAIIQSLSHGFVSSALFLVIGSLYDRWHTRVLDYYGGLVFTMPLLIIVFFFFTLANLALPGTSSFVGEFLLLTSTFEANTTACFFGASCTVLSAIYSLWLFNRVSYGNSKLKGVDLTWREFSLFVPLIICTFLLGVYPSKFFRAIDASVSNLIWSVL